jgi:hypothetical protein
VQHWMVLEKFLVEKFLVEKFLVENLRLIFEKFLIAETKKG